MRIQRSAILAALLSMAFTSMGFAQTTVGAATRGATFIDISCPGAAATIPRGVNNRGHVVGVCYWADGLERAFIYKDGIYSLIPIPNAVETTAQGINDRGDVVGNYFDADYNEHGFLFSGGTITTIDVPDTHSTLIGINNSRTMIGIYVSYDYLTWGAFVYLDGNFTSLEVPNAVATNPTGINDVGTIVGNYAPAYGEPGRDFVFQDGSFTTYEPADVSLVGVNNTGEVAVNSPSASACYVQKGSSSVWVTVPGSNASWCLGISDNGYVTGQSGTSDGLTHGFLIMR